MSKLNKIFLIVLSVLFGIAGFCVIVYLFITPEGDMHSHVMVGQLIESDGETVIDPYLKRDVYNGVLRLLKGTAKLKLNSGVIVTMYSPLECNINNNREIFIKFGTCLTEIPEQKVQFKYLTPNVEITSFESQFGISTLNKQTKLFCFEGSVNVYPLEKKEYVQVKDGSYVINESGDIRELNETWEDTFNTKQNYGDITE